MAQPLLTSGATELKPLIQAELAKRFEVHPSTIRKRRHEADFHQWSQTKDPDGIPWSYNPDARQFFPQL